MKSNRIINFGIIGCGVAGNRHALAISKIKGAKLVAVSSFSNASALKLASKYPQTLTMSPKEIISSKSIDVLCICSPNIFHSRQALAAIKTGKHLIVEKPLALKINDAQKILSLSNQKKVLVSVVFPRRFDKTWLNLYKLFKNKILGQIKVISIEQFYFRHDDYYINSNWHGKKDLDGGILLTQGIHYLDLLTILVSASCQDNKFDFKKLSANSIGIKQKQTIEVPDTIFSHFLLNEKILGSINISTSIYPGWSSRVFISCEKGSMTITNDMITSWGVDGIPKPSSASLGWAEDSVTPIIKDMINAIVHNSPLSINLSSVIDSLGLTLSLTKSIKNRY